MSKKFIHFYIDKTCQRPALFSSVILPLLVVMYTSSLKCCIKKNKPTLKLGCSFDHTVRFHSCLRSQTQVYLFPMTPRLSPTSPFHAAHHMAVQIWAGLSTAPPIRARISICIAPSSNQRRNCNARRLGLQQWEAAQSGSYRSAPACSVLPVT